MSARACRFEGCTRTVICRRMCRAHWEQARANGKLHTFNTPDRERFWSRVDQSGECWEWTAYCALSGYGQISVQGKHVYAHRYSYELANGPIPEGLVIDHICHNPPCVKPAHLRLSDNAKNGQNRKSAQANSQSGILGVSWEKRRNRWLVVARTEGVSHFGGRFRDLEEAKQASIELRARIFPHASTDWGVTSEHSA